MNTIKNITYLLIGASILAGCAKNNPVIERKSEVPKIYENESILLHPDYLSGKVKSGYTIFKDIDSSGDWDLAVRVRNDSKENSIKAYYKKGFGPPQGGRNIEFVDSSFFKSYE